MSRTDLLSQWMITLVLVSNLPHVSIPAVNTSNSANSMLGLWIFTNSAGHFPTKNQLSKIPPIPKSSLKDVSVKKLILVAQNLFAQINEWMTQFV